MNHLHGPLYGGSKQLWLLLVLSCVGDGQSLPSPDGGPTPSADSGSMTVTCPALADWVADSEFRVMQDPPPPRLFPYVDDIHDNASAPPAYYEFRTRVFERGCTSVAHWLVLETTVYSRGTDSRVWSQGNLLTVLCNQCTDDQFINYVDSSPSVRDDFLVGESIQYGIPHDLYFDRLSPPALVPMLVDMTGTTYPPSCNMQNVCGPISYEPRVAAATDDVNRVSIALRGGEAALIHTPFRDPYEAVWSELSEAAFDWYTYFDDPLDYRALAGIAFPLPRLSPSDWNGQDATVFRAFEIACASSGFEPSPFSEACTPASLQEPWSVDELEVEIVEDLLLPDPLFEWIEKESALARMQRSGE